MTKRKTYLIEVTKQDIVNGQRDWFNFEVDFARRDSLDPIAQACTRILGVSCATIWADRGEKASVQYAISQGGGRWLKANLPPEAVDFLKRADELHDASRDIRRQIKGLKPFSFEISFRDDGPID